MSLPAGLVVPALEALVARSGAVERPGAGGGPFLRLTTVGGGEPAGAVRVFGSHQVPRIVYVNIDVPDRDMDSHMFYAFAPADSAVPHFTLDAVATRGILAFHVDLVPRVDLATHVDYMDRVFAALSPTHEMVGQNGAFSPAVVSARGRALMSPWMLALRSTEDGWADVEQPCHSYLDHWLSLAAQGLDEDVMDTVADTDLADRDARLRRSLFGLDIDPAWDHVAAVVGADPVAELRATLLGH